MPKGYVTQKTIDKQLAREEVRKLIVARLPELVGAQVDAALGIKHFMLRDRTTGQFKRLTDADEIVEALNAEGAKEGSTYYIYTKDAHTPAFTDLLNRALDKPAEQEQAVAISGDLTIKWEG